MSDPGRTARLDQERAAINESVEDVVDGINVLLGDCVDPAEILVACGAELAVLQHEVLAMLAAGACLRLAEIPQ